MTNNPKYPVNAYYYQLLRQIGDEELHIKFKMNGVMADAKAT